MAYYKALELWGVDTYMNQRISEIGSKLGKLFFPVCVCVQGYAHEYTGACIDTCMGKSQSRICCVIHYHILPH